ncbi:ATP-grasp domain-containing protein [Thalassomonas actiniarum]|uniref:Prokaryotic glutathione synthetase ATP-binding domain-containing protein n=1 Tax=Thalassomonas actiniarum TaxID=485447 RepID=A0AAE9YUA0_9GAMM|nr:hypothetical protein [Thalassomonas actiniarum]WDD99746.1 hypothetical protein SG35_003495 [Thalassomonas actiniarum]
MKHCAILTMDSLENFEAYDHLLEQPLKALGWQTHMVSWRDQEVNWDDYQVVIIRTPWDYQDDAPLFLQVLEKIEASNAVLENSLDIVRWNIDKNYLRQLETKGVTIVPTLWPQAFDYDDVLAAFKHFSCEKIVLKPRISANADNTFLLTREQLEAKRQLLADTFASRAFMVQPFMENICSEGEYSCFYFDGQYSHSILKTPKDKDFRVQEEHGGRLTSIDAEDKLLEQATVALKAINELPLYARVDFVRYGQGFALMEAELIEPSLYFNMDDNSAARFARAFVERMARLHQL